MSGEQNNLGGNKGFVVLYEGWQDPSARWFRTADEAIRAVQRGGPCEDGAVHRVHPVELAEEVNVPILPRDHSSTLLATLRDLVDLLQRMPAPGHWADMVEAPLEAARLAIAAAEGKP